MESCEEATEKKIIYNVLRIIFLPRDKDIQEGRGVPDFRNKEQGFLQSQYRCPHCFNP